MAYTDFDELMGQPQNKYTDFDELMGKPAGSAENEETKNNGWLGWGKDAFDSGVAGVLQGQANFVDVNTGIGGDAANYLGEIVKSNSRTKQVKPELTNIDYYTDPQGALYDVMNGVGSMTALGVETAAAILGAQAAGVGAAGTATAGLVSRIPAGARLVSGVKNAWSTPLGKLAIGNVATSVPEAISQGGNIVDQMREEGKSEDEIQSAVNKDALMNLPFLASTKALESAGLLGASKMSIGLATRILGGTAIGGSINALEEGGQSAIDDLAQNKPIDWDDAGDSAKVGLLVGGLMGAGGGAISGQSSPTQQNISGNADIDSYINQSATKYNLDPALVHAVAQIESSYDPTAVSEAGAQGIMQLMPDTAKGLGVEDSFNPQQNIDGGAKYLAQCLEECGGDIHQALAMYNGGAGYMNTAEAQAYADKVLEAYGSGSSSNLEIPREKFYNVLDEVSDTGLTDLTETKLNLLSRDFKNKYGFSLDVTSMKRNGKDKSWHNSGEAIDVVADVLENDAEARAWLIAQGQKYGLVALDEYTNPSANATGGHIHFSDHGEPLSGLKSYSSNSNPIQIDGQEFQNDNEYLKYLIDEKIETAVQNKNTDEWNFLEENANDKEAIMQQYPDIVEKMAAYYNNENGERGNEQQGAKQSKEQEESKVIDRAIAYYDRTQNPAEKMLLEQLVNSNNIDGLKLAFPFLDDHQNKIPKFKPGNTTPIMEQGKKSAIQGLANVLDNVVTKKYDDMAAKHDDVRDLVGVIKGIGTNKQQSENENKLQQTASALSRIDIDSLMKVAQNVANAPMTNRIKQVIGKELAKRGVLPPAVEQGVNFDQEMLDLAQHIVNAKQPKYPVKSNSFTPNDFQTQQQINALTGQPVRQSPKPGFLRTAEDKIMESAYNDAVNSGDYIKAMEIANQIGNKDVAKILGNYAKFSYSDRHGRDRQRMKEAEKAVQGYIPEDYQGIASGVTEGLAEHEKRAIEDDTKKRLKSGKTLAEIEKFYQVTYNRIKANKSDGMSIDRKVDFMRFLQGAINHVREQGRTFSRVHEPNGELNGRDNTRGDERSVQRDNRSGDGRSGLQGTDRGAIGYVSTKRRSGNNGELFKSGSTDNQRSDDGSYGRSVSGVNRQGSNETGFSGFSGTKSSINETKHPDEGAFSIPENKPKYSTRNQNSKSEAAKRSASDEEIVQMVKMQTGNDIHLEPAGVRISPKLDRIAQFGEQMGCLVRYYTGVPSLRGFHIDGVTYINRKSELPHKWVFWHESFHWIKANNKDLYNDLLSYLEKTNAFSEKKLDAYREETGRYDLSDADVIEEMMADAMPDVARRVGLMKQMAKENPSLAERFVGWISDMMDRFVEFFKSPADRLNQEELRNFVKSFSYLARDMLDRQGRPIFSVVGTGKINLRRNGKPAASALRGDGAVAYSAEGHSQQKRISKEDAFSIIDSLGVEEIPMLKISSQLVDRLNASSKENLLKLAIDKINSYIGKSYTDPNGSKVYFSPGKTESLSEYALHLAAGQGKELNDIRSKRVLGILLADKTIQDPLAIIIQDNGRKMYLAVYSDGTNYTNGLVVGVEDGQDGRVITSTISADNKRDKKAAIREIKKRISGCKDLIYFREGLSGHSRPSTEQQTSMINANLHLSGSQSISQNSKNMQDATKDDIMYSFSNDNSKESLSKKIKNFFVGGRGNDHIHTRTRIKNQMQELLKTKIAFGKLGKDNADVVFKQFENVIRAKNAYDWEKIMPKVGRLVSRQLGLKESETMDNYIADWFMTGATNNTSVEAIEFAQGMKKNKIYAEKMCEIQESFQEWNQIEAMERGRKIISFDKPKSKSILSDTIHKLHDEFVEELGPVQRLVSKVEKKTGKALVMAADPYTALRLFRGNAGKSMAMLEGGEHAVRALRNVFTNINFDGFKTISMILTDAGIINKKMGFVVARDKKKMEDFITYATAKHIKDIHLKNRGLIGDEEPMETAMSEADCDKIIASAPREFIQSQKDLVQYSNTLAAILADSGVISRSKYFEWKKSWPNHVPLFRVFEENENIDFGDSTKRMTGSKRNIINPLEGIVKNTYTFIKRAEKNRAKAKLANLCRFSDVGEFIELVDNAKPNDNTTITYLVDGKPKYLQTDPDIVKAVNMMNMESSNMMKSFARMIANFMRAAFTMANPEFGARNAFADVGDAIILSKYGFTPADFVRGLWHALKKDEIYYEFIASGAGQASAVSMDRNYTKSTLDKLTKSFKQKALSPAGILDVMQSIGEYSEYGTRIGAYAKARSVEQKKAASAGKRIETAGITEAALEARDLADFARNGKAGRTLNTVSLFSNASIQGWSKFFRTFDFTDPKQKKHIAAALFKLSSYGVLALFLWLKNHDDKEYKQIPDWQKEKHFIIRLGDSFIRIPKGHDLGIQLVTNWMEKGLSTMYDKDPLTMAKILSPIKQAMPNIEVSIMKPLYEAVANYSLFTDSPIVPGYQEKLPNKLQYGSSTSSLAKFIGEQTGLSPRKVDHVIFGYTGGMGRLALTTYDKATGSKSLNTTIEEYPLIRGFMISPYKNAESVKKYYEVMDEQIKLYNEYKATGKRPEEFDPKIYSRIKAATPAMQRLSKIERSLVDNQKLSVDEKKAKQEEIQKKRIALAKNVMGQ